MYIAISSFFRIICTLYLYEKLLPKYKSKRNIAFYITLFIIYIFTFSIHRCAPYIFSFVSILTFYFFILIFYDDKFDISFVITSISYALYYIIGFLSSFIVSVMVIPLYYAKITPSYEILTIIVGILSFTFLYFIFKIKRLKSGMTFVCNGKFIYTGIILSFGILFLTTLDQINYTSAIRQMLIPLATFLLAFLLFAWWRRQITKSYIEKLRKLELQSLYDEIDEKDKKIQKLAEDNESLARIIHKDNKLIPAMESAVLDFLQDETFINSEKLKIHGQQLATQLRTMSQERKGILNNYQTQDTTLIQTGNVSVDTMLAYMQKKAHASNIRFEFKHTQEALNKLLEQVSENDLSHLLSDLLENAIIAIGNREDSKIQVTFGQLQKESYISVADTGIPFEIDTLHQFGIHKHTTHEDTGGSGIGLMDIWLFKKKYRASIQIQEYQLHRSNFTKKITLSLNRRNHYVVQSYRHMDIINTQTRGDLYVIPSENNIKSGGMTND